MSKTVFVFNCLYVFVIELSFRIQYSRAETNILLFESWIVLTVVNSSQYFYIRFTQIKFISSGKYILEKLILIKIFFIQTY